jgi:hypothetical protein
MRSVIFFNLPNPFSRTRPWSYSASNRNEYQKRVGKKLGSKARPARKADNSPSSASRLSIQCGILNISQSYKPPVPVMGIYLLFFFTFK